ncbi:tRNA glutamyl-Q(34) synthetase GluQRS [Solimonas sp. K1W22B-7]|uniref:tRNA glutamyl-Q(34) synthetase GluQRS n=1 Tax=Solimonas sp. K1W22B-7 TaxID=2303331 RepID=UPI000E332B9C|nr:tRNA glutamyl-Q(34) synthetase GluQRS [Solimonas sp. K1W22B-7]AXQ29210.1 tRNA glutamyl-Q(34) synthetase GluQRS [Solimonas sp. K1W22B-7]
MQHSTDDRAPAADGTTPPAYIGRFAPTPSGPLHLGSLLTAAASWLQARSMGGRWLLRIDDLDRPRCPAGMDTVILRQLEAHGLEWDGTPRYQTACQPEYDEALEQLAAQDLTYPCSCSRAQLQQSALPGPDGPVYDGRCRTHPPEPGKPLALRCRAGTGMLRFVDGWRGLQQRDPATEVGDFVLRRSDGMTGYQLACAVDEHEQGITEVARGADLLGSTFRQIAVMRQLGWEPPAYRHGPLLLGDDGLKLSKQNHAAPLADEAAGTSLWSCLQQLRQEPPRDLRGADVRELLAWALQHWRPGQLLQPAPPAVETH